MGADASHVTLLKPRLLSDPPPEVYRLEGKYDTRFDLPQSQALVLPQA
jgi:hypothetical protein